MEVCSKEMETSSVFLKERTNILELKHMLPKILNEEGDLHLIEQDKYINGGKWIKMH